MRLLVIDHDAAVCATLERCLGLHGLRVECANDLVEGLHRAALGAFDLVILSTPLETEELCAWIRAIVRHRPLPGSDALQIGELRLVPEIRDAYFRRRRLGLAA